MRMLRVAAVCVLVASSSCATGIEAPLNGSAEDNAGEAGSGAAETSGAGGVSESAAGTSGSGAGLGSRGGSGGGGGTVTASGGGHGPGGGGAGGSTSLGGAGAGGSNSPGGGGAGGKPGTAGSGNAGGGASGSSSGGTGGSPPTVQPKGLSVSSIKNNNPHQTASSGGTSRDDACPQGQVLIGFNGTIGTDVGYLRSVSGVCATLTMQAQAPYAITTTQAASLPVRETAKAIAQAALCPANQVVVGFQGRSGGYIDAIWFKCAPLSVGPGPGYGLVVGATTDTALIGGQTGGSPFNAILCAANQVAVAQQPTGGNSVNSFGFACSEVAVVK